MATIYPLAPNVPVTMHLKYIDVWPNDPSKNNGKGFGASLALTGTIDGADRRVYPKGFLDRHLSVLAGAGVIAQATYDHDPPKKYSIPVLAPDVVFCMEQPAGERYAAFAVRDARGGNGAAPSAPVVPPAPHQDIVESPYARPAKLETPRELKGEATRAMLTLYGECLDLALRKCQKLNATQTGAAIEFTGAEVCAMAATLFIESNKRGLATLGVSE